MNWKSPEPIILAVASLVLALGAGYLAYSFPDRSAIVGFHTMEPNGKPSHPLKAEDLTAKLADWNSPVEWALPSNGRELFDSAQYMFFPAAYPGGDYIKKIDLSTGIRSPSGVLLSWYAKNQLDVTDSSVDREDPDGDGFSNITEFKNEPVGERYKAADCDGTKSTDPRDPKSHPDYLARLRLKEYESKPFHVEFRGYQELNGSDVFQLYLKDAASAAQPPLKKTGDPLGVEGYVVGPFVKDVRQEMNPKTHSVETVDHSTLEIDRPDINLKIVVPFRGTVDSPESTADFVILMPTDTDKVIKVSQGKILTISYLPNKKFILIEANADGAKIQDVDTKQEYHILKLDPAEWDEVPLPATPPAVKQ